MTVTMADMSANPPVARAEIPARGCESCGGVGYVFAVGEDGYERVADCSCLDAGRWARAYNSARIPALMHGVTLESSDSRGGLTRTLYDWTLKVADEIVGVPSDTARRSGFTTVADAIQAGGLRQRRRAATGWLLYGPTGTGKTHLMAGVARACVDAGVPALYVRWPDVVDSFRGSFGASATVSKERIQSITSAMSAATVLVVDELGAEIATDYGRALAERWIGNRIESGRKVVIATNLSTEDGSLRKHVTARVWSRFASGLTAVKVGGKDRRSK